MIRSAPPDSRFGQFLTRVIVVIALVGLTLVAWWIRHTLLLAFGGLIVSVVILALARPLSRLTGLPHLAAVATATLLIGAALGLALWQAAPALLTQAAELREALPQAVASLRDRFPGLLAQDALTQSSVISGIAGQITLWSTRLVEGITAILLVVLAGLFFAAAPGRYTEGLVRLVPPSRQETARHAVRSAGTALRAWLLGQLVAMGVVGSGVALGTWMIGLPAPLALGLVAGLLEFVPVIGPILGAIPALLLAMTMGWSMFVWTAGLYLAVEQLESNMLLPMIERSVASVPPALFLLALVAIGTLFGLTGVILAAPLTVVGYVLVNELYVKPLNDGSGA
ncbi:MAG: AI-2E family transporter [Tranquillimonas sp.]